MPSVTPSYHGHTYYFCNESCLENFKADPKRYLEREAARRRRLGAPNRIHVPDGPGNSTTRSGIMPKCGMALEPVTVLPQATRTEYTCPMHPEIVRDEAGKLPYLRDGA